LSSDGLRVFIAADRAVVVRVGGGMGSRRRAQHLRTLHGQAGDADGAALPASLAAIFEEAGAAAQRVKVVLSNQCVRYLVVPWSPRIANAEEREALARHAFGTVFGAAASGWTFVVSPAGAETSTLAAAVDTGLLGALSSAAERSRAKLQSVQPLLMTVFNHWRRDVGRDPISLLLLEPGRWCWASLENGAWRRAQSGRLDGTGPEALAEIIARQLTINAASGTPSPETPEIWVYGEGDMASSQVLGSGPWRLRILSTRALDTAGAMNPGAEHALLAA
jgi:hypothetical protein